MNDIAVLLALLVLLGLVLALASRNPLGWAREEWRRMRAHTWAPEDLKATDSDRTKTLERRQRALAKRMRKKGRHLYAGKAYKPALTAPAAPARPPKAGVVVPIRRKA